MKNKKATLSIRIDETDKESFEQICNSMGLSVSDAVKIFVKKVINERAIPFEVKLKK